jgi:predicted small integral membrane protein
MIPHFRGKLAAFLRGLLVGAAAGGLTMAICNLVAGTDRAGHLANLLRLGNGIIFATLLGGVTGAWLALGGRRRIAGFMGLVLGVLAGWVAWQAASPYVWVIDVILISGFGEGAQYFTGFVVLAVLYVVIRWVGLVCESVLLRALARPTPPASP